jgi:hypothetical protein
MLINWGLCFSSIKDVVAHQLGSMLLIILVFCVVCLCFVDFVCLRPVSCVHCNITSFSGMSIFD